MGETKTCRLGRPTVWLLLKNHRIVWRLIYIFQVKIQVFDEGVQKTWFLFDGIASTLTTWMHQSRLIASPYEDVKTGSLNYDTVEGQVLFLCLLVLPDRKISSRCFKKSKSIQVTSNCLHLVWKFFLWRSTQTPSTTDILIIPSISSRISADTDGDLKLM